MSDRDPDGRALTATVAAVAALAAALLLLLLDTCDPALDAGGPLTARAGALQPLLR